MATASEFAGKRALVTGSTRASARRSSRRLRAGGATVFATARHIAGGPRCIPSCFLPPT